MKKIKKKLNPIVCATIQCDVSIGCLENGLHFLFKTSIWINVCLTHIPSVSLAFGFRKEQLTDSIVDKKKIVFIVVVLGFRNIRKWCVELKLLSLFCTFSWNFFSSSFFRAFHLCFVLKAKKSTFYVFVALPFYREFQLHFRTFFKRTQYTLFLVCATKVSPKSDNNFHHVIPFYFCTVLRVSVISFSTLFFFNFLIDVLNLCYCHRLTANNTFTFIHIVKSGRDAVAGVAGIAIDGYFRFGILNWMQYYTSDGNSGRVIYGSKTRNYRERHSTFFPHSLSLSLVADLKSYIRWQISFGVHRSNAKTIYLCVRECILKTAERSRWELSSIFLWIESRDAEVGYQNVGSASWPILVLSKCISDGYYLKLLFGRIVEMPQFENSKTKLCSPKPSIAAMQNAIYNSEKFPLMWCISSFSIRFKFVEWSIFWNLLYLLFFFVVSFCIAYYCSTKWLV